MCEVSLDVYPSPSTDKKYNIWGAFPNKHKMNVYNDAGEKIPVAYTFLHQSPVQSWLWGLVVVWNGAWHD